MPSIRLPVPYQPQGDNDSGSGWRECFSSSAAMVAAFYRRIASDNAYNRIRARFGDTTDPQAQTQALRSLGLLASFRTDGTIATLRAQIGAGRPVMVGWLHRGPVTRPEGGGHWGVIVGCEGDSRLLLHDPAGDPLLLTGGHHSGRSGAFVPVSVRNWSPRWEVEGPGTGWLVTVRPI